jgi:hypothetical protein
LQASVYHDGYFYFGTIELIGSKKYARKKAAKLGADAVEIVDTILDAGTTYRTSDYIQITPTKKHGYIVRLFRSSAKKGN